MIRAIAQTFDPASTTEDAQIEPNRSLCAVKHQDCARWFDPHLTSEHLFVTHTVNALLNEYEGGRGTARKRTAKARDAAILRAITSAVVCNVVAACVEEKEAVNVTLKAVRRTITRYEVRNLRRLPETLDTLSEGQGDVLSFHRSNKKGTSSRITPSGVFRQTVCNAGIRPEDLTQSEGSETIRLARVNRDYVDGTRSTDLIDYDDTEETIRFRAEMTIINDALCDADMKLLPDGDPPVLTGLRELRRHFSLRPEDSAPRFDQGGRLFGAWWLNLDKERRHAIRLNGEPVADLDFAQMFLRLAYLQAGIEPPPGDLYAGMAGRLSEPHWRPGIKKVANAMLFREGPLTRLPRDAVGHLPPGMTGRQIRAAFYERHPGLEGVFESGVGLRLMFLESQILVAALLKLIELGITAVQPMHDGVMVPESRAAPAAEILEDAAERIVGYRLPVHRKSLWRT